MDQSMEMVMIPSMTMKVSPGLIAANHILALSSQELQLAIDQELAENPALELIEKPACPSCGAILDGKVCSVCSARQAEPENGSEALDSPEAYDSYFDTYKGPARTAQDSAEDVDLISLVASESTLEEQLLADVRTMVDRQDFEVAEYLIGNLDERGFLTCTVEDAAAQMQVEKERVEKVLKAIQETAPLGIGARDFRECFLIQLDYLEQRGVESPYVRRVISDYLTEFAEHKFGYVAQCLGTTVEEMGRVRDFIKSNLNPYPVQASGQAQTWSSPTKSAYLAPDVIISVKDGRQEIVVVESKQFFLRISDQYQLLTVQSEMCAASISEKDKEHIRHYLSRARLFLSNINQRRETLRKVAECLAEAQNGFISKGVRHLKPLTRAMVAERIGLHESTVSRATAGKYVMLPSRKVVPFSDFFAASLSIKDAIREFIASEREPLSDQEIVVRLRRNGIRIARRTVAKYRNQLGILPSTLR